MNKKSKIISKNEAYKNRLDIIKDIFFLTLTLVLLIFIIIQIYNIFQTEKSKTNESSPSKTIEYNFPDSMTEEEIEKQKIYDQYLNYIMQNQSE